MRPPGALVLVLGSPSIGSFTSSPSLQLPRVGVRTLRSAEEPGRVAV